MQIMGAQERASKEDIEKVFTKVGRPVLMAAGYEVAVKTALLKRTLMRVCSSLLSFL